MEAAMELLRCRLVQALRRASMLLATALAACVSYGPQALAPRVTLADAKAEMGTPSGEYTLPDGGMRLEFARGPYGKHTWMLDFDASGQLVDKQQVLSVARFNEILPGMPVDEVLRRIGHPSERSLLPFQHRSLWSYRYESPFCLWFQIGIAADGQVVDAGNAPDPMCEEAPRGLQM
jgi:hypothetical protein